MFLDAAIGIFTAIFISNFAGIDLAIFFVLISIFFVLLPDMDFLFLIFYKKEWLGKFSHKHRDIMHYPLIYIPIGAVIFLFLKPFWSLLFVVNSFFHFLHDTAIGGFGIRWLWPFSKNYFAIFPHSILKGERPLLGVLYVRNPEEVDRLAGEQGDPYWFRNAYLSWNKSLVIELFFLIVAIILLLKYLK